VAVARLISLAVVRAARWKSRGLILRTTGLGDSPGSFVKSTDKSHLLEPDASYQIR